MQLYAKNRNWYIIDLGIDQTEFQMHDREGEQTAPRCLHFDSVLDKTARLFCRSWNSNENLIAKVSQTQRHPADGYDNEEDALFWERMRHRMCVGSSSSSSSSGIHTSFPRGSDSPAHFLASFASNKTKIGFKISFCPRDSQKEYDELMNLLFLIKWVPKQVVRI